MIKIKISGDLLKKLRKLVKNLKGGQGPVQKMWFEVAAIYRGFILRRFRKFSRGEGNWPQLSPSTIAAKGSSKILIDKGFLVASLNPAFMTGGPVEMTKNRLGVEIRFSSSSHQSSGLTIADLARVHQLGLGTVPKRKILVKPDDKTMAQIGKLIEKRLKGFDK